MRIVILGLLIVAGLFLGVGFVVAAIEPHLLFHPKETRLEDCNLPKGVRQIDVLGERGLYTDGGGKGLLVFYHGNAQSACNWRFLGVNHVAKFGYDTLAMEYPGFSGDPLGRAPGADTIREMVARTHQWAEARYQRVVAGGYSLGTGAAAYHASLGGVAYVALFAPYQSLYELAQSKGYPFPRFWFQNDLNSVAFLSVARSPVHVVYGGRDRIVPAERSEALIERLRLSGVSVTGQLIENARHSGLFSEPDLTDALKTVLAGADQ